MQSLCNYKYDFVERYNKNQVLEMTIVLSNKESHTYIIYTNLLQTYLEHNWTIPDSLIIAIILMRLKNKFIMGRHHLIHKGGCKFGEVLDKINFYSDIDAVLAKDYEGLSYQIESISKYTTSTFMYTYHYKLDKNIWTKEYKKNFITLLRMQSEINF